MPSALSQAKIDGTLLNVFHMIDVFNHLQLDLVTFGNDEFDLNEDLLIQRINQSKFRWISSNVKQKQTLKPFPNT